MNEIILEQHLEVAVHPQICQRAGVLARVAYVCTDGMALFKGFHQHVGGYEGKDGDGEGEVGPSAEIVIESCKMLCFTSKIKLFLEWST